MTDHYNIQNIEQQVNKKYKYSYFKPSYQRQKHRNYINSYNNNKSQNQNLSVNMQAFTALKDFQSQKERWESLRQKMRGMKIDSVNNIRYRETFNKDNKSQDQIQLHQKQASKSKSKQNQDNFFLNFKKAEKQNNNRHRKNQSENYIKHLQVYCSTHLKCFEKYQNKGIQIITSKSKQTQNLIEQASNFNTEGLIKTNSSQNHNIMLNKDNIRVTKVYKSNSVAPKYTDRISIKRAVGPIQDLIAQPQDLTNRLILQRKTLLSDNKFFALELSIIYDRYIILVNIMGQKRKRLSLVLNKHQSKIITRQFQKSLEIVLDNIIIGKQSITLKQSFSKLLQEKEEQFRESRHQLPKTKRNHPYLGSGRRLDTPATNITNQYQRRQQKIRTSLSQRRNMKSQNKNGINSNRSKNQNNAKFNKDIGLFQIQANGNTDSIQQTAQKNKSKIISEIGQSGLINNISQNMSKQIRQSIPNNSQIKQQNNFIISQEEANLKKDTLNLNNNISIVEQVDESIQESRLIANKKKQQ